jgi:hypothetical protein
MPLYAAASDSPVTDPETHTMSNFDARPQYQAPVSDARVAVPGAFAMASCSWSITPLTGVNADRKHVRPRRPVISP